MFLAIMLGVSGFVVASGLPWLAIVVPLPFVLAFSAVLDHLIETAKP